MCFHKLNQYLRNICCLQVFILLMAKICITPKQLDNYILSKYSLFSVVELVDLSQTLIHSGHFYSTPSSPLLLRGAPDYSTDTASKFNAEAHRQLQVKDLPKVPTCRLEWESNPRPSG